VKYRLSPGGSLSGEVRVPGDKSISHRAVIFGSLAEGTTRVTGFLEAEDTLATVAAFRAMGVDIEGPENGELAIRGVGMHGLRPPAGAVDLGNSGTSMRLLAGLLAGQAFDTTLRGDASLSARPMDRIVAPLARMGADIESGEGGVAPLRISGGAALGGIRYELPMASAQVKSCVLLAGLYAKGRTAVAEPAPTRDHTERMLRGFGYRVERDERGAVSLEGGGLLRAVDIEVPADISSAAFFLVAASIAPGSDISLAHVGVNPTRAGAIDILRGMGADIQLLNEREVGAEPVADIRVRAARLRGIDIPASHVPSAIDEFPALFIAAACAEGRTTLRGAGELRVKESDRIAAMAQGLKTLGVACEVLDDGIVIDGFGAGGGFGGGAIESHRDHRIAMSFAVAAPRARAAIEVRGADTVATSFPGFDALASRLGLNVSARP